MSKSIIDPDLDKLDDAVEVIADQIGGLLDPTVRKKVYTVVVALNVLALAVGSSLIAAGGFIGGEVGVTLLTVGGITTAVGTALGGAASALARKNV